MREFILHLNPNDIDKFSEAFQEDEIFIGGWAQAEGLLDETLSYEDFKTKIAIYMSREGTSRKGVGYGTRQLWNFIREMEIGDIVVIPPRAGFLLHSPSEWTCKMGLNQDRRRFGL